MPFQHAAAAEWGRWLRSVFASRSPNVQVVGQDVEDALRGVVQVADMRNLAEPIRWAQAATRRQQTAVALQVARIELHCLSPGGLWVDDVNTPSGAYTLEIADVPVSVPTRTSITDFGNIPTVSVVGAASVIEAAPVVTLPVRAGGGFDAWTQHRPYYVPPGKVLLLRSIAQNATLNVQLISWREIPAPR